MTYRIVFQIVLFLLPFLAYGVWRLARQEAIEEGRKPWPPEPAARNLRKDWER